MQIPTDVRQGPAVDGVAFEGGVVALERGGGGRPVALGVEEVAELEPAVERRRVVSAFGDERVVGVVPAGGVGHCAPCPDNVVIVVAAAQFFTDTPTCRG